MTRRRRRTPLHSGPIVAAVWIVFNIVWWTLVAACTLWLAWFLPQLITYAITGPTERTP